MPKTDETPLSDEWSRFVMQLKYLDTRNESNIDDTFKALMKELHALLQLSVDLGADHQDTVQLPDKPPIYFNVEFAGIRDQPSQQEYGMMMNLNSENDTSDESLREHLFTTGHARSREEELFKTTGASGRTYRLDEDSSRGTRMPRPPPRNDDRGRGVSREPRNENYSQGRPRPDKRDQRSGGWNQQLSYYSNPEQSQGGGSSTRRSVSPYRSADSRRNVTDALSNYCRFPNCRFFFEVFWKVELEC